MQVAETFHWSLIERANITYERCLEKAIISTRKKQANIVIDIYIDVFNV